MAEVLHIDVGCQGVKSRSTVDNVSKHDIRGKDLITISMSALRFSSEIANAFIDCQHSLMDMVVLWPFTPGHYLHPRI